MGNLVTRAGMSQELFRAPTRSSAPARGVAMATVGRLRRFRRHLRLLDRHRGHHAKVAYPAMKELGYSDRLSTGAIARRGTLGILIPPSTIMVIYGVMTETNIGKLFAAGIMRASLATLLLCFAVQ